MLRLAAKLGTGRSLVYRRRGGALLLPFGWVNARRTGRFAAMTHIRRAFCIAVAALSLLWGAAVARAAEPITIGLSMALTGGLAAVGKSGLLAMQIWAENINTKGGLLGRPVKLVYYDDQSNPATVPGIYTKLLDVDKVDLIIGGYGTNMLAPLMPIAMERKL